MNFMRIMNNIAALNVYNKLNKQAKTNQTSMEKLSSGLRINKAADDAAGLSISEKMRSQIRGLDQADRNILDGISLIQTAEGGLSQIADPNLLRLRELAVQASNATYTAEDRQAIQNEVSQLISGIDEIATNTEFNTQKVLRPSVVSTPGTPGSGKADIVFVVDNTGSMAGIQTTIANNFSDLITSISGQGVSDIRMGIVEYTDNEFLLSDFNGSKWSSNQEDISNEILRLASTNRGATENAMTALNTAADSYDFRDNENGAQTKHIVFVTNETADDSGFLSSTLANLQGKGIHVHGVYQKYSDTAPLDSIVQSTDGKFVDLSSPTWGTEISTVIGDTIGESAGSVIEDDDMPILSFQVGANAQDLFKVELTDVRATTLGIQELSVLSTADAQTAIGSIDQAMQTVSSARSKLGAYQNALEHTMKNINTYSANLTNAESRIRDTDMAKELMEQTKTSILTQSSQAMLAQSLKLPQGVLELLK